MKHGFRKRIKQRSTVFVDGYGPVNRRARHRLRGWYRGYTYRPAVRGQLVVPFLRVQEPPFIFPRVLASFSRLAVDELVQVQPLSFAVSQAAIDYAARDLDRYLIEAIAAIAGH